MLFRVFTLAFEPGTERFDDAPVRDYIADKDVEGIEHQFFMQEGRAYLAVIVRCRGVRSPAAASDAKGDSRRRRDESWRDLLDPKDWPLFERLREWRGDTTRAEGIPSYVICNNRQLAEIVKRRPRTLAALAEVNGFGEAKLKKYGKTLLEMLQRLEDDGRDADKSPPDDPTQDGDGVEAEPEPKTP
jgi:ATP-dependent DNA helicase RecQ